MNDFDSDSELGPHTESSSESVDALLRELGRAERIEGALQQVVLPEPLQELSKEANARSGRPEAGTLVEGRYRLESPLGRGGMGVVFAATHLQTGKPVAVKWMLPERLHRTHGEREKALQRFAREARVAGRLRHPNIVDIYDAGSAGETPYLVMERLEGETLRARIERAALGWDELMALLVPAMLGVAEVHKQGVVHRDLKPDNIFLAQQPGSQAVCAKVLDFGVSLLQASDSSDASLTHTGTVLGTPAYMPLEQLSGEGRVDRRTDIYAMGVVLFEALTGRRPYQAKTAAEYGALLAAGRPTRLSEWLPDLKGAREAAIMKALARDPGDRHASMEAFIAALRAANATTGRSWLSLGLILALGLGAAVIWYLFPAEQPASRAREAAGQARARATAAATPAPSREPTAAGSLSQPASPLALPQGLPTMRPAAQPGAPARPVRTVRIEPPRPAERRSKGTVSRLTKEHFDSPAASEQPAPSDPVDPATRMRRDDF